MYAPFKNHSMSKDDKSNFCQTQTQKRPICRSFTVRVVKPIMVKTDVKEGKMSAADRFAKRLKDKHGMDLDAKLKYYEDMKKKMQQTSAKVKSEENNLEEMPRWKTTANFLTLTKQNMIMQSTGQIVGQKKEGGGRLRHSPEYYAQQIQRTLWYGSGRSQSSCKWLPKIFR